MSPTVAEISLPALRHNLLEVARRVRNSGILAVVKANAYGHGAVRVSHTLINAGIHRLGVATVAEGIELRCAGIPIPILVMAGTVPEEYPAMLEHTLTPVLQSLEAIQALGKFAADRRSSLTVHLKIDTGMARLGLAPEETNQVLRDGWPSCLQLEGLMSHLATADDTEAAATERQLAQFRMVLDAAKSLGFVPLAHVAGSAGILNCPASYFDMVRPGLMLYGYSPCGMPAQDLRPVLTWKTRVIQVRSVAAGQAVSYGGTFVAPRATTLAVLAVGYADGYSRALSNRGRVLIGGQVVPVVGRVCMDLTIADVTELPRVNVGDEVVLLGQQGAKRITADDLAGQLGTISYEILTQIGSRVVRVYKEEN